MKFEYVLEWDYKKQFLSRKVEIDIVSLDPNDLIIKRITKSKNFYEYDLLNYLNLNATHGGIFIDVGTNIGNHSIFFGKFMADQVVCIEPSYRLHQVLERNLSVNKIKNSTLLKIGVGAEPGFAKLVFHPDDKEQTGMTQLSTEVKRTENVKLVEVRTLDSVVDEMKEKFPDLPVNLVKIDVEGMQMEVMEGFKETLKNHKPQLVIEANSEEEQTELFEFLKPFGYEPIGQFCATPTFHLIIPNHHKISNIPKIGQKFSYNVQRVKRKIFGS